MPEANIIISRMASSLDNSVRQKAFAFLEKLGRDDSIPGLNIEPIRNSIDRRVRTGRVNDQYRAVLFRIDGEPTSKGPATPVYVLHGIWNHDEAIAEARRAKLRVNPVNGITEIIRVEQPAEPDATVQPAAPAEAAEQAGITEQDEPTAQAGPAEASGTPADVPDDADQPTEPAAPILAVDETTLVEDLGLEPDLARAALASRTDAELYDLLETCSAWQSQVLLGLATGSSVEEVREELALRPPEIAGDSDDALRASFERPASQMQFAMISGSEELRRVIEEGDFGAWRVFLHPTQRKWAEHHWNGPFRLSGGAGTGKTVVALHRTRMLARANPEARVILTTFTVNLANELSRMLRRLDPDLPLVDLGEPGVHVCGIDSLASAIIRRDPHTTDSVAAEVLGRSHVNPLSRTPARQWQQVAAAVPELPEAAADPLFLSAEYRMVVLPQAIVSPEEYLRVRRPGRGVRLSRAGRQAVWQAVEEYRRQSHHHDDRADWDEVARLAAGCLDTSGDRPADHVLVDEGQDLTPNHWLMVRALVEPGRDDIFIAEDGHQRIYGHRLVLSRYGIATRGRSRRLTLNYRTTQQNLEWATAVLEGGQWTDLDDEPDSTDGYRSARSGPRPTVKAAANLTEELDLTAETLKRWMAQDEQRGVREPLAVLVRDRATRDRVATGLQDRGVMVTAVDREALRGEGPFVLTMHRAKGTEFTRIVLFGVSQEITDSAVSRHAALSADDGAEALLRERALLYVAASRARDELVVTWTGQASSLLGSQDDD